MKLPETKVIFKPTARLTNSFLFKDKLPFNLCSNVVYKFSCGRCNATYNGERWPHFYIKVGKHSNISPLTGKKSKVKTITAIKDHVFLYNHVASPKDYKILASSNSEFHLKIK